jgi:cephalosporin-C deacetylase-like acetyl esterase
MRGLKLLPGLVVRLLNSKDENFDEFWDKENELWELSMRESFRQRDERLKKLKKDIDKE